MTDVVVRSETPEETEAIAQKLARVLQGGEYLSLEGDLGAGKTLFARALVHALGGPESVTSPTFVLQKTYELPGGRIPAIVHYDFYRIQAYAELLDMGFEDPPENAIVVAEWGEKFVEEFPGRVVRVQISGCADEPRTLTIRFGEPGMVEAFRAA
jgi:tRNA threonylcarbamoyladenosine biosynthesis protein TsaE